MSDCLAEVLFLVVAVCLTFHRRQRKAKKQKSNAKPNRRVANNVTKENACTPFPSPFPAQSISHSPRVGHLTSQSGNHIHIFYVYFPSFFNSVLLKYFLFFFE